MIPWPAFRAQARECLSLELELIYQAHVHFSRAIAADRKAGKSQPGYKPRQSGPAAVLNTFALPFV